ncbi:MAG: restriction endonuclease [Candidatus Bathyarchaeota archaeon]|nr:restriction endonuclease [Candidatus Bathyarchaeota archaeon]
MTRKELVENAEVISAVRNYANNGIRMKDSMVDFTVSPSESDGKILIRVITEAKSSSGYVGVEAVREMSEFLEKRNYDKGILIGKRFTEAARSEMERTNIEAISKMIQPHFKVDRLYFAINSRIENLCKMKCSHAPKKESDCRGYVDGNYSCDVRLISDNASFHLKHGWTDFLKKDLARLLTIEKHLQKPKHESR